MLRALAGWAGCAVVLLVLLAPHDPRTLAGPWYARLPVEAPALAALLLLGRRASGLVAVPATALVTVLVNVLVNVLATVLVAVLALVAVLDAGMLLALGRPFDLVLDWSLLGGAADYLAATGVPPALGRAVLVVPLAVVPVVAALAVRAAARTLDRHRDRAVRVVAALVVVWTAAAVLGPDVAPGVPFAARGTAALAVERPREIVRTLGDVDVYDRELAVDRYRDVPADRLLTGLRGRDVLVVFVESYGRVAVDDPAIGPAVGAVLDDGTRRLRALGLEARSGWLASPTSGGASWLAHSTLLSGTEVDTPPRYRRLVTSDRFTLVNAFGRAGWRTAAVMPALDGPWPEQRLYGFDQVLQRPDVGYRGPRFGWSPVPDQVALEALQRRVLEPAGGPVMAGVVLTSSHSPWVPLPRAVDWTALGDGSVFGPQVALGRSRREVWSDPARVRTEYGRSVAYSLTTVVAWLERYGGPDTVVVLLGDHQPLPLVAGVGAVRDVPVSVVAAPDVLAAVGGWGWTPGLRPTDDVPVGPMAGFRDRFLAAYSTP